MENLIKVNRPIFCPVRELYLNKGVTLRTDLICKPMAHFLKESQEKNGYSLVGDLGSLYRVIEKMEQERITKNTQKKKSKYELGPLPRKRK